MNGRRIFFVALALATSVPAAAQNTRLDVLRQARLVVDDSTALRMLLPTLGAEFGPPDSLWAVIGIDIAQILIRQNETDLAGTFLRAVARHGATWPIDRSWYRPSVVAAYDAEARAVAANPDQGDATTAWTWPDRMDPRAQGTISVAAGPPVTISVSGGRSLSPGGTLSLAAGTYELTVSGDGYEPLRIRREVLPGAMTTIELDPIPLLPAAVAAAASSRVVRIGFTQSGQPVCRNGYLAGTDGIVVTTWNAIRDAQDLTVTLGTRTFGNVTVLASDEQRDIAVLKLDTVATAAVNPGNESGDRQYAWAMARDGCGDVAATRTRVSGWTAGSPARLDIALPVTAAGAPLIDRGGLLIGLVTGPSSVLPEAMTRDVIDRARRSLIAIQIPSAGGRFPWKWVGLGAAAAGGIVVLASGGGGGGTEVRPPTTGTITISFN